MEWNLLTAQNLAVIERKTSKEKFSPAEYEIVRRLIYATADLEYQSLINFLNQPLSSAAAALSARVPVLVDNHIVQSGVNGRLEETFLNPVYCLDRISLARGVAGKKLKVWQSVARRYPSGIYIISDNALMLLSLLELIEAEEIKPSLIIATPAGFIGKEIINNRLQKSSVPQIRIDSSKGGIGSAIAIFRGIIDLTWISNHQSLV